MTIDLKSFRAQYPQYAEVADADLADGLYKKFYANSLPRNEFNTMIGYKGLDKNADDVSFFEAIKAGIENIGGAGDAFRVGINEALGDPEGERKALEAFNANRERVSKLLNGATDWRDIANANSVGEGFGRTLDYVKEQLGLNSPQMAAIMAGGFSGAAVAPLIPNPIAAAISKVGGFTVGATAVALPMFTGWNVGRQIDEGSDIDLVKAGAMAVPQALTEAMLGRVFSTTGLTNVGSSLFGSMSKNAIGRVSQKIGEALAVGVPAEVIQQGFERAAADLKVNPLESEDAAKEYLDTAIATVAALAPMGSISIIGETKGSIDRAKASELLKEDIKSTPAPKSNAIQNTKEAESALRSLEIDPEIFTPEARIKAANVMIDRIDSNRMKFLEMQGYVQPNLAQTTSPQQLPITPSSLKTALNSGTAIPSRIIEMAPIPELSQAIQPREIPDVPEFDSEAPTEVLAERARVVAQRRQNAQTPKFDPTRPIPEPTLADLPGSIVADAKRMSDSLKDISKANKTDLIDIARKPPFNIPEKDLKNDLGQYITKDKVYEKIVQSRVDRWVPFQRPTVKPEDKTFSKPLGKVTPEGILGIAQGVEAFKPAPAVTPKFAPVSLQMDRASKEVKTKINFSKALRIDKNTGRFVAPVKAAQTANFVFTSYNFNNTKVYPNMDLHLMESWEMHVDSLSKSELTALEKNLDTLKKNLLEDISEGVLNEWMKTPSGRRTLMSHLFADYAQANRMNVPTVLQLTPEVKREFDKVVKLLKKTKEASRGLQANTFEDVFPKISEEGITPRDAMFDSVKRLQEERLLNFSDELQMQVWKDMDKNAMREYMDESIQKTKGLEATKKTGIWARNWSMFTHLASSNPIASVVFNLRRAQEDYQATLLTKLNDVGNAYFSQRSKEVRTKAAEVLDHLRATGQKLERGPDGSIVFQRGTEVVSIKHPDMIEVIEGLDKWGKTILGLAEADVRTSIEELIPGTMGESIRSIKESVKAIKAEKSLNDSDIQFLEDQVAILENISTLKDKPYVPRMRFGSFGFTVHRKENVGPDGKIKPNSTPVYHSQVEAGKFEKRYDEFQYKKVQEELKKYKSNPKEFVVFEDSKSNPFEMTYDNIYNKISRDNLTLELIAGLVGADKTEDYFVNIKDKMDRKTKYRGFQKRFADSQDIAGYSTDWDRVINSYNMGAAHFFSKSKFAPLMDDYAGKVQSQLSDNHTWLKKKIEEYVNYTNSPHDSFQTIRSINFVWTMGGNISSALLQTMTLPTTTLASMTQYDANLFKNVKRISKYTKMAFSEFDKAESSLFRDGALIFRIDDPKLLNILRTKYKMTEDQIKFNIDMFREGRSGAAMLEENTGVRNFETRTKTGSLKEYTTKATTFVGIPISAMEQITRFVTANAHYDMFKNNPEAVKTALKILKDDHRFQGQLKVSPKDRSLVSNLAYFGMDESHAVFGKVGRSDLQKNAFGAFVFPFMTYPQSAVEFLSRMYGRDAEGKRALATSLGLFFLFAGLIGLPGGELLKELLEEAYKATAGEEIDLERLIREKMTEVTGEPRAGMFITQGLFRSVFNMDISRRIGLPIVGQEQILAFMGVRGDMTDILGVQGSMLTNAIEAWHAYKTDESGTKIASLLTPTAISNLLKAYNYTEEGVRTSKGTQLVDREDMGVAEIFMRAVGITTGRVASSREEQYWRQLEGKDLKPKMDAFRSKGKNISVKLFRARQDGDEKAVQKYQNEYRKLTKDVTDYLAEKNPYYDIGAFHKAVLDAVDQSAYAGVRLKDYNKEDRGKAESIRKASGKEMYEKE